MGTKLSTCAHTFPCAGDIITAWAKLLGLTFSLWGHLGTGQGPKLSCEFCILCCLFYQPGGKNHHLMQADGWVPTSMVVYLEKVVAVRHMADLHRAGQLHSSH